MPSVYLIKLRLFYDEKGLDFEASDEPKNVYRKEASLKVIRGIEEGNPGYYRLEWKIGEEDHAKIDFGAIIADVDTWEYVGSSRN